MLKPGDILQLDLGIPEGREAGFRHPAVLVTAQRILDVGPSVVHVVPMTSTLRASRTEVRIEPDAGNGLDQTSAAQCQHVRSVSTSRVSTVSGNVGPAALRQIRELLGLLLDIT